MKTNITKQIILGTLITFGLFSAAKAQTAYDDQAYTEDQSTYNQPQQQQQYQQQYQQPWVAKQPLLGIKGLCSSPHESDYLAWESNTAVQPVFLHRESSLLRIQSLAVITCKLAICQDERQ